VRFRDRVVIVTGGAGGVGRATCLAFAREGAAVAVIDRAGANAVADEIASAGGVAVPFTVDVSRAAEVDAMVSAIAARFGRIDVLVNNAGVSRPGRIEDVTEDEWDHTVAVNLKAHFLTCRAVLPRMRRQGSGQIVNVSSVAGRHVSLANSIPYTSAKAGVIGFTRHLAQEVARDGIRVNAVAPGPVRTPLFFASAPAGSDREARIAERIPIGRLSEPEEQAAVILFLASDEASFVHGAILDVNGGIL
jgi:3-oxoacyl-[acyl-carrier protein] reductase